MLYETKQNEKIHFDIWLKRLHISNNNSKAKKDYDERRKQESSNLFFSFYFSNDEIQKFFIQKLPFARQPRFKVFSNFSAIFAVNLMCNIASLETVRWAKIWKTVSQNWSSRLLMCQKRACAGSCRARMLTLPTRTIWLSCWFNHTKHSRGMSRFFFFFATDIGHSSFSRLGSEWIKINWSELKQHNATSTINAIRKKAKEHNKWLTVCIVDFVYV